MNDISATIFYNQRIILSAPIEEPIVWRCTKVEQISPKGISRLTFAQTTFNSHTDYIEKDEDGNVIGMWASYWDYHITPKNDEADPDEFPKVGTYAEIKCSGVKPFLKIGGSYKTLTVNFLKEDEQVPFQSGDWSFTIDGEPADNLIALKATEEENKIKIKFTGDDSYIGKIITCVFKSLQGVKASFELHIESL